MKNSNRNKCIAQWLARALAIALIAITALFVAGCDVGSSAGGEIDTSKLEITENVFTVDEKTGDFNCAVIVTNNSEDEYGFAEFEAVAYDANGNVIEPIDNGGLVIYTGTIRPGGKSVAFDKGDKNSGDNNIYDYYKEIPARLEWKLTDSKTAEEPDSGMLAITTGSIVNGSGNGGMIGTFSVTLQNSTGNDFIMDGKVQDIDVYVVYRDESGAMLGVDRLVPAIGAEAGFDYSLPAGAEKTYDWYTIEPMPEFRTFDLIGDTRAYYARTTEK